MHIQIFIDEAILCISRENGSALADLLGAQSSRNQVHHNIQLIQKDLKASMKLKNSDGFIRDNDWNHVTYGVINDPNIWHEVLNGHLNVLHEVASKNWDSAFSEQASLT